MPETEGEPLVREPREVKSASTRITLPAGMAIQSITLATRRDGHATFETCPTLKIDFLWDDGTFYRIAGADTFPVATGELGTLASLLDRIAKHADDNDIAVG